MAQQKEGLSHIIIQALNRLLPDSSSVLEGWRRLPQVFQLWMTYLPRGEAPVRVWVADDQCRHRVGSRHDSSGVRQAPSLGPPAGKAYTAQTGKCEGSAGNGKPVPSLHGKD